MGKILMYLEYLVLNIRGKCGLLYVEMLLDTLPLASVELS